MPLKVSDGMGAWISDFKKSDAPQFKGKDEKERREMAIAAYMAAKRDSKNESTDAYGKSMDAIANKRKRDAMTSSDKNKLGALAAMMAKEKKPKKEAYRPPTQAEIDADKRKENRGKSRPSMTAKSATRNVYKNMMGGLKKESADLEEKYSWNDVNKALTKANYMRGNPAEISKVAKHFDHKSGNDKKFSHADVKKNLSAAGIDAARHHDVMKHMKESVELEEAKYGFFGTDNPKIGDAVKHRNGASGKVKKIETQGNETWVHFKDKNGVMNSGRWKKSVTPTKESTQIDELDSKTYRSYSNKAGKELLRKDLSPEKRAKRAVGQATADMKKYGDKRTLKQRINGSVEENLDELKKSTLGSYVNKASRDAASKAYGAASAAKDNRADQSGKDFSKSMKRLRGINTATKKLAKESYEHISEDAWANTGRALNDYARKSGGIDKKDFEKAANYLYKISKADILKKGDHLKDFSAFFRGLDTDVREKIYSILKQNKLMEAMDIPFSGPYKKAGTPRKDRFGNVIKPSNIAKHLAKKAAASVQKKKPLNAQKSCNEDSMEEDFDTNFKKRIAATVRGGKGAEYLSKKADQARSYAAKQDPGGTRKGLGPAVVDRQKAYQKAKKKGLPPGSRVSYSGGQKKKLPEGVELQEEMMFKVAVEGLPNMIMMGRSPGDIKNQLRKIVKQPSMIGEIERMTAAEVKKRYRDLSLDKDEE